MPGKRDYDEAVEIVRPGIRETLDIFQKSVSSELDDIQSRLIKLETLLETLLERTE